MRDILIMLLRLVELLSISILRHGSILLLTMKMMPDLLIVAFWLDKMMLGVLCLMG